MTQSLQSKFLIKFDIPGIIIDQELFSFDLHMIIMKLYNREDIYFTAQYGNSKTEKWLVNSLLS